MTERFESFKASGIEDGFVKSPLGARDGISDIPPSIRGIVRIVLIEELSLFYTQNQSVANNDFVSFAQAVVNARNIDPGNLLIEFAWFWVTGAFDRFASLAGVPIASGWKLIVKGSIGFPIAPTLSQYASLWPFTEPMGGSLVVRVSSHNNLTVSNMNVDSYTNFVRSVSPNTGISTGSFGNERWYNAAQAAITTGLNLLP